ncbi:membrane hypothetical protein [metagenome]|uniref:Methylamine utilisation protein MauE domain-containing protein n=1 Tax=metagenome TaxID=256318 RepID=A0A2P2CJ77_9ZZZZ
MVNFAAQSFAVAGAIMLLLSGIRHVRDHRMLLASMLNHGVLPYRVARGVARSLPSAQALCGGVSLVALSTSAPEPARRWAAVACLGLYVALVGYLASLLATGKAVDCACFGRTESVTVFSLARVALPAAAFGWLAWQPHLMERDAVVLAALTGAGLASLAVLGTRVTDRRKPAHRAEADLSVDER